MSSYMKLTPLIFVLCHKIWEPEWVYDERPLVSIQESIIEGASVSISKAIKVFANPSVIQVMLQGAWFSPATENNWQKYLSTICP